MKAWSTYLAGYHATHPGVTEDALTHAGDARWGTAYDWLAAALPGAVGAVLDIACGSAPMYARLSFATYLGLDLSAAELHVARSRGRGPLAQGDARRLPVASASIDTAVCAMGLMLVRPVEAAVRELGRVVRPDGRLGLLLPATGPLSGRDLRAVLALTVSLRGPGSMPQLLGPRRIRNLLQACGFAVDVSDAHRFAFPLRTLDDARLAVTSLYTPGRSTQQLLTAQRRLARVTGPHAEVGVPLRRVIAHRLP